MRFFWISRIRYMSRTFRWIGWRRNLRLHGQLNFFTNSIIESLRIRKWEIFVTNSIHIFNLSFDFNVSYSSGWGYSLINTFKLKKKFQDDIGLDIGWWRFFWIYIAFRQRRVRGWRYCTSKSTVFTQKSPVKWTVHSTKRALHSIERAPYSIKKSPIFDQKSPLRLHRVSACDDTHRVREI